MNIRTDIREYEYESEYSSHTGLNPPHLDTFLVEEPHGGVSIEPGVVIRQRGAVLVTWWWGF